jgi:two-component system, OmpR family, response regulator
MRILCLHDEATTRTILALALGLDPEVRAEVVDSADALLARARLDAWDAFVLAGAQAGAGGHELCRRLKGDPVTAGVPVVFLSARAPRDEVARVLSIGASACLTQPFDPLTLARDLRAALAD